MSGRGLLAVAAGAVLALTLAPAARAQQAQVTVDLTAPKADSVFDGPVTTSGSAHASGGVNVGIDWIKAELVWGKQGAPPPMPKPLSICGPAPGADPPPPPPCQGGSDVSFTNAPVPTPLVNGPYQLVVTAHATGQFDNATGAKDVKYAVAIRPGKPGNPLTSVKSRVVTVGWDRNGEPDMYGYDVYRQVPNEKPPTKPIVRVLQPEGGTRVSFVDDQAPAAGGEYTYSIYALRPGKTADFNTSVVGSDPAVVKATLPPGTPGAPTPPTQPPAKGGTGSPPVIKGTGSNAPRLSSASAASSSPSTTEPVTPDPGFVRDLPFGATTVPGDEDENNNVAIQQSGGRGKSNQRGILIPAATGAILFVAAFQLRWLKQRLEEPPTPLA